MIRHRHIPAAMAVVLLGGTLLYCCGALRTTRAGQAADEEARRSLFDEQIAPLLARHCLECHDSASRKGGLDLSRKESALAGGESGPVLVAGKSGESLLWQHVESGEMPQNRPPLADDEKRRLRDWIDAGAEWTLDVIDASAVLGDRRKAGNWVQRLTVTEYIDTVRAAAGVDIERDARRLLPRDVRADGFSNTAYNLPVDLAHVEAYSRLAQLIVARMDVTAFVREHASSDVVTRTLAASGSLKPAESEAALREAISGTGKWLLRGPLMKHELEAYLSLARAVGDAEGTFTEALSYVIESMLQSPRFLYRIEDQSQGGAPRPVGDYELASRLAYILWGGPPDRELFRAAEAGELADREHVETQVARMLEDPRAVRRSLRFIHDWLDLDRLAGLRPSPERFPQWNEQLAADMRDETLAFFEEVVWKQRRPLWDLLNAQVTWATPRLAQHYGLDSGGGERLDVRELVSMAGLRHADAPARVNTGLQALYTFEDVTGGVVRDTSGAGEPLDLTITDPSAVHWSTSGLAITSPTIIATRLPPGRLIDAMENSRACTLEAWITPANTSQSGPARILTFSADPSTRNFTLGQDGDSYEVRFRTTSTDANGQPALRSPGGAVATRPTHVVFTRDESGRTKLYIDAEERASGMAAGDLSNWEPQGREDRRKPAGLRLAFGNELTRDRPWLGTLHRIALYSRALSPEEVRFGSGPARYDLSSVPARGGLLTQGSVLTIGGDEASMVARGLFVLHELLSSRVGNRPPCVDTSPVPTRPGLTQRGAAEARIANSACAGCHSRFEPLAFGLERFDGIGGWSEKDHHGNPLREDGEILFPGAERPVPYTTSAELMDLLAGSERVRLALTRKVTQFALGRPLVENDRPIVDRIHAEARERGGTYAATATAIVLSDLVRMTGTQRGD